MWQTTRSIASKIRRVTPIINSKTPPMCEECGELKIQETLWSCRKFLTGPFSTSMTLIFSFFTVPTKLVPLSERNSLTGPRIVINRRKALINDETDNSSTSSMCIALVLRHVKSAAHRLLFAAPPLVILVRISHGPFISTPTNEKRRMSRFNVI